MIKLESIHTRGVGKEHSRSHLIQLLAAFIFFFIWILDSFIFMFSTGLASYIHFIIRIILCLSFLIIGLFLIFRTGHILFNKENVPSKLIKKGIFAHTRHPLYLGVLIIYLGLILLSVSLLSIIGFIVAFILYNWIATFEESDLEKLFKEEYLEYKKRVPKWIPSFRN
ncbi:MAG: isoprenylcysteine carboxylmethyltransferase family protein [Candidatus Lokiarchaeota archaeon]|nr:isoprenylcysteine carboxylmethyltransferase family protein [Candidatus Lokiarchaeota archaeon]